MKLYLQNSPASEFYTIRGLLGTGKNSVQIFKAISPVTHKTCAIKLFNKQSDDTISQDFIQEREVVKTLSHPNILTYFDFHQEVYYKIHARAPMKECSAIVMEYIPYGDLASLISKKPCSEKLARTLFRQMLSSLEYLHNEGYAHMDLKPENFLLNSEGIKLIDFDVSQRIDDSKSRSVKGTLGYRAPEIARGDLQDTKAADIYSLGVVLFHMVAGMKPYDEVAVDFAGFAFDDYYRHLQRNPKVFWEKHNKNCQALNDAFSEDFKDFIEALLQENYQKRPSIEDIKKMKWYEGEVYRASEIEAQIKIME
jgi:serine/threonine protein kinase